MANNTSTPTTSELVMKALEAQAKNKTWNVGAVLVNGCTWSAQTYGTVADGLALAAERAARPVTGWDEAVAFMVVSAEGEVPQKFLVPTEGFLKGTLQPVKF